MGGINTFGAVTQFETNRLAVTEKNLQAPDQRAIHNIIKTFAGDDQQTRSQVAFATIIKKIHTSESNESWIYLLKNLIIFDKIVGQGLFISEIANLDIPKVTGYIQKNQRNLQLGTNKIVRSYWKLIQKRASILHGNKSIICYSRGLRYDFLSSLPIEQVQLQITILQQLFVLSLALVYDIVPGKKLEPALTEAKQHIQGSGLINYINLQLLYQLFTYYSCYLLCIKRIVSILVNAGTNHILLQSITDKHLRNFQISVQKFKNIAKEIVSFAQRYKQKKGFEVVNYRQLDPFKDYDIFKVIENFQIQKNRIEQFEPNVQKLALNQLEEQFDLIVQKIPKLSNMPSRKNISRIKMELDSEKKENAFYKYSNSYSDVFPPKEIMTVHLMKLIRQQKQENLVLDDPVIYGSRQSCIYNFTEIPKIQSLIYQKPKQSLSNENFNNQFSGLPSQWVN